MLGYRSIRGENDATPSAGTSKASEAERRRCQKKVVAELRACGVKFEEYDEPGVKAVNGVSEGGGAKAAWFKDTEGNIMAIVEDVRDK